MFVSQLSLFHPMLRIIQKHCLCPISGWTERKKSAGCPGAYGLPGVNSGLPDLWDCAYSRQGVSCDTSDSTPLGLLWALGIGRMWHSIGQRFLGCNATANTPGPFNNLVKENHSSLVSVIRAHTATSHYMQKHAKMGPQNSKAQLWCQTVWVGCPLCT